MMTGLRVANEVPVSRIDSNDSASTPDETVYREVVTKLVENSPFSSVIFVSAFT